MGLFLSDKELKHFFDNGLMGDMEGIYFAWKTKPEVVESLIPPHLKMVAPIINTYITKIKNPNFAEWYGESALGVPVTYKDRQGVYFFSFLLDGPGAEIATILGRELAGIPKMRADKIHVERDGNHAYGYVERHGIKILEANIEIGQYNTPEAQAIFGDIGPGKEESFDGLFYKYDVLKPRGEDAVFYNGYLLKVPFEFTHKEWEPATAKITLTPSTEDSWADLEVVEVLGGGWGNRDLALPEVSKLEDVDANEIMPYLFSSRFDSSALIKR